MKVIANKKTDVTATADMASPKMAGKPSAHGLKRHLSTLPSLDIDCISMNQTEPEQNRNAQVTKRRVFSFFSSYKFEFERKTGNDPERGHGHGGNDTSSQMARSESKMAAPIEVNKLNPNEPLHKLENGCNKPLNTVKQQKSVQINKKHKVPQAVQPNLNDSIEITDDSTETDETAPELSETVKSKADRLHCIPQSRSASPIAMNTNATNRISTPMCISAQINSTNQINTKKQLNGRSVTVMELSNKILKKKKKIS